MIPLMLNGTYNPGQLVAVREILDVDNSYDTAVFSGNFDRLSDRNEAAEPDDTFTVQDTVVDRDGIDTLRNIERLQFNDQTVVLSGDNNEPVGMLSIVTPTRHLTTHPRSGSFCAFPSPA